MSLRQLGIMNQNLKAKLEEVTKERDEARAAELLTKLLVQEALAVAERRQRIIDEAQHSLSMSGAAGAPIANAIDELAKERDTAIRERDEVRAATQAAVDACVDLYERKLKAVERDRDSYANSDFERQLSEARAECERLKHELVEMRKCWGDQQRIMNAATTDRDTALTAARDATDRAIEAVTRAEVAERERDAIAEAYAAAPETITRIIESRTAEAIARYLISPELVNETGVDLTNPECPIGVALSKASVYVKTGAWRQGN